MAGESARESARRQREKAKRLQRSAALYERGAEGEQATAGALSALPAESWTVFHDVRWPGRRYANVDHIVVGPPGLFVIDSKNWSGAITVRDDVLRQNGSKRETAVAGAAEASLAVGSLVPSLRPELIRAVLCFVRDEPLTGWARDVMVCSTANVADMLLSRPIVLGAEDLRQLTLEIDAGLRAATDPVVRKRSSGRERPTTRRTTASRSRRRRASWSGLVPAIIGLGMAAVLILRPDMVSGLANEMSGLFVENIVDKSDQPPANHDKKEPASQLRDREQRQP